MPKKTIGLTIAAVLAAGFLIVSGFAFGFETGRRAPTPIVIREATSTDQSSSTVDLGSYWEAWSLVNDNFLKNPDISNETKVQGSVAGLLSSLGDPYTEYFNPQDAKLFKQDVEGNFGGIGAEIGAKDGFIIVVAPMKDSPAMRAGLKTDDKILMIDATSTENMGVDKAVSLIRGKAGTTVTLNVFREGWDKPKDITITREIISLPTLDLKMLPDRIAYIQLYQFNTNAPKLFFDAIRKAALANAHGVILDLRGDPGGYVEVAKNIAGWFLKRGTTIVREEGRNGINDTLLADGNEALAKIPVVVLIDKGSASASEILAGTLRDNRQIKLVGETSFGKGTVQEYMDLSDGSIVKITIAHWVLPSGRILDHDGLKPDYEVKLTEEDAKNGKDPQLDKAVQVLKDEIK